MKAWFNYARPLIAATALVVGVAACDETLEGGIACPTLCPSPIAQVLDTTILAVEFDTTVSGFPPLGSEQELLLASRGDTLDARAIIRFDSIPTTYRFPTTGVDSNITAPDSAMIYLKVADADTLGPPITIELYDVDLKSATEDTVTSELVAAFDPSRLIGSRTFAAESLLKDTLKISFDPAKIMEKIQGDEAYRRLRLGVKISAPTSAQITIYAQNGGAPPILYFRPAPDSGVFPVVLGVYSKTPLLPFVASDLADFQLIAKGPAPEPANVLRVGGLPGRRVYLRFNIPSAILDSSEIIRARLLMTQRPNPSAPDALDTAGVQPFAVAAGSVITDFSRLLFFLQFPQDTVGVVPADSQVVPFEIIDLVRSWRGTTAAKTPRAIALRATREGASGWLADFWSSEAAESLRPRLRIYYVPRKPQGIQ